MINLVWLAFLSHAMPLLAVHNVVCLQVVDYQYITYRAY